MTHSGQSNRRQIQLDLPEHLMDHQLAEGSPLLPGATLLLKTLLPADDASKDEEDKKTTDFEDILLLKPVFLCVDPLARNGQKKLERIRLWKHVGQSRGAVQIQIFTEDNHTGRNGPDGRNGPALVAKQRSSAVKLHHLPDSLPPRGPFPVVINHSDFYDFMCRQQDYSYGPAFRSVQQLHYGTGFEQDRLCAWGRCWPTEEAVHKGLDIQLDALWQAMAFCVLKESDGETRNERRCCLVPFSIGQLQIGRELLKRKGNWPEEAEMYFHVQLEGNAVGHCWMKVPDTREMLLTVKGLMFRPLPEENPMGRALSEDAEEKDFGMSNGSNHQGQGAVLIRAIACRLPGGVNSPEQFWRLLSQGRSTEEQIPASRIPERESLARGDFNGGNVPVEGGHFLRSDLARFDARFFDLSALEAAAMDPQQRILLECTWECLEKAGLTGADKAEAMAQCGFFVGFMGSEYPELEDPGQQQNALQMLGSAASTVSGRLAHFFDSRGPALSVDTACSSSLVALQLAVDSIQKGRCPRALVAGVNLTLTARGLVQRANGGMLSKDGCCRSFDADASGYGRADGCVAILVESVLEGEMDTVPHWARIEAIETGHDGRSAALTAPNGLAQQELLCRCLGQLSPAQKEALCCWECHGTGTALGDPVEFLALAKALSAANVPRPVLAGAAKASIGHTEAASGLVGLMKAALQLRHGQMPPLAHFRRLNPEIERAMTAEWGSDERDWPLRLAVKAERFEHIGENENPFLAGLSSFGVAGTLCCALLSLDRSIHVRQSRLLLDQLSTNCTWPWQRILPLSARSERSLQEMTRKWTKVATRKGKWPAQAFCAEAALRRRNFHEFRSALLLENGEEFPTFVENHFIGLRFRLGFWDHFERAFLLQVPAYQLAFRSILAAVNVSEEEVVDGRAEGKEKALLQLADTFARFRCLADFGLIREEDEEEMGIEEEENEAEQWLRQLLWSGMPPVKETVLKCLRALEAGQKDRKKMNMKNTRKNRRSSSQKLLIGPDEGTTAYPFASIDCPEHLQWLLAHGHLMGLPLRWSSVFPLDNPSLLQLLPVPSYPFDRSRRFWKGRDAWAEQKRTKEMNEEWDENDDEDEEGEEEKQEDDEKQDDEEEEEEVEEYEEKQEDEEGEEEEEEEEKFEDEEGEKESVEEEDKWMEENEYKEDEEDLQTGIHRLLCSALPSGQLPSDWLDCGLNQLGLDSLALMSLAQALNQHFRLDNNARRKPISPGEVFMVNRARDLVQLIRGRMEEDGNGKKEEKKKMTMAKMEDRRKWKQEDMRREKEEKRSELPEENKQKSNRTTIPEDEVGAKANECIFQPFECPKERKATSKEEPLMTGQMKLRILCGSNERMATFGITKSSAEEDRIFALKLEEDNMEERRRSSFEHNIQLLVNALFDADGQVNGYGGRDIYISEKGRKQRNENGYEENGRREEEKRGKSDRNSLIIIKLHLDLVQSSKDAVTTFRSASNCLLLLARALLHHLNTNSTEKIKLRLSTFDQDPLLAFGRTFFQNIAPEIGGGRLELVDEAAKEIRFKRALIGREETEEDKEEEKEDEDKEEWKDENAENGIQRDWKPRGTWLITGGTGGIGLEIARWLVNTFSPQLNCLLLLARHRPASDDERFWHCFHQMQRRCPGVELVLADVTDAGQLEGIFGRPEVRRHLHGVVHSAGTLLNAPLAAMDPAAMAKVCGAKAEGALLLCQLLDKYRLNPSHFVVNSSLASLHPSPGQSAYAAANALCDALVRQRRAKGLAGTTLNWANWLEVGMAARRPGSNEQLRWLGLPGLSPGLALRCFHLALQKQPVQWLVAIFDWTRLQQQMPTLWARFELDGETKGKQSQKGQLQENGPRRAVESPGKCQQPICIDKIERLILQTLREQLNGQVNVADEKADLIQLGFMELGLDSLRLYQFAHSLNRQLISFGLSVTVLDLFEWSNVKKLAEHLKQTEVGVIEQNGCQTRKKMLFNRGMQAESHESWLQSELRFKATEMARHHRLQGHQLIQAAFQLQALLEHVQDRVEGKEDLYLSNVLFHRKISTKEWEHTKLLVKQHGHNGLCLVGTGEETFCSCADAGRSNNEQSELEIPDAFGPSSNEMDMGNFYDTLRFNGMDYGPKMQLVSRAMTGEANAGTFVRAEISGGLLDSPSHGKRNFWALAELALQTLAIGLFQHDKQHIFLPAAIERLCVKRQVLFHGTKASNIFALGTVHSEGHGRPFAGGSVKVLAGPEKEVLLQIEGIWASRSSTEDKANTLSNGWNESLDEQKEGKNEARSRRKIKQNLLEEEENYLENAEKNNLKQYNEPEADTRDDEKWMMKRRAVSSQFEAPFDEVQDGQFQNQPKELEIPLISTWPIRPDQDLAILSISGTFSGCASVDQFWEALLQGRQCFSTLADADANVIEAPPGLLPVSGISPGIEHFDPGLFAAAGLSLAEWRRLDPQLRLLAMHGYAALEQSGYGAANQQRAKLRIGCFVGAEPSSLEYTEPNELEAARGSLLGMHRRNQQSFSAQWLSHLLGLRGPSVSVYSACSSSLSALAQAQLTLLSGKADLCLVASVHLVHPSQIGHQPVEGQPLAKSATHGSWPFCSQSEGILMGSACVAVVLARPKEAVERADPVMAIMRSIALTNDAGQKQSFMAPSVVGQREAIQLALVEAGLPPEAVAYWECHAAGTALGDTVELQALDGAFFNKSGEDDNRMSESPKRRLLIGSSKANLGHCFAASGLCSLVKLVQMLRTRLVPAQPMPSKCSGQPDMLNPFQGRLAVHLGPKPVELANNADGRLPLCVGTSSFGIGGTNGALLLMEALPREHLLKNRGNGTGGEANSQPLIGNSPFHLFPLSAASRHSLKMFAAKLAEYVQGMPSNALARVANTLQHRREHHHQCRAFVLARDWHQLWQELRRIAESADEQSYDGHIFVEAGKERNRELGLFFGPQGVQFPGMFRAERRIFPSLDAKLRHLCAQLEGKHAEQLMNSLNSTDILLDPPAVQCGLFAISHSILALLREAGLGERARVAFGHSLGELTALSAVGAFPAEQGMRLLWHRGELVRDGTRPAKMLMLRHEAGEEQFPPTTGLHLSAHLSPGLSVFVGSSSNVHRVAERISLWQGYAKVLDHLGHGFHSCVFLGPIQSQFREAAAKTLEWAMPEGAAITTTVLSNLDGKPLDHAGMNADYMAQQMVEPVRLDKCLETLLHDFPRVDVLLEIGPPTMLRQLVRETEMAMGLEPGRVEVISTMRRNRKEEDEEEEGTQLLRAIGQLWQHGFPVNFERLFGLPSWEWDPQVPGYQFDLLQLNPSGKDLLKPFNPSEEAEVRQRLSRDVKSAGKITERIGLIINNGESEEKSKVAEIVAQVWQQWLPNSSSSTKSSANLNFEEAGGNSLQAAQIAWELEKRLALPDGVMSLDLLFRHPRMDDFINVLWRMKEGRSNDDDDDEEGRAEENGQQIATKKRLEIAGNLAVKGQSQGQIPAVDDERNIPNINTNNKVSSGLQLFLPLRPMPSHERLRIFCIHPISGSALVYRQLAQVLPQWASVVGVQFADQLADNDEALTLNELAQHYAEKIRAQCPNDAVPLLLVGHSLGGVLAREIGLILNRHHLEKKKKKNDDGHRLGVPVVVMFDSWALGQQRLRPRAVGSYVAEHFVQLAEAERNRLAKGAEKLAQMFRNHKFSEDEANSPEIWLFRAAQRSKLPFSEFIDHSRDGGWARLCPRLHLVQCEADHEGILDRACLKAHQSTLEAICELATIGKDDVDDDDGQWASHAVENQR